MGEQGWRLDGARAVKSKTVGQAQGERGPKGRSAGGGGEIVSSGLPGGLPGGVPGKRDGVTGKRDGVTGKRDGMSRKRDGVTGK